MKITKQLLNSKKAIGTMFLLAMASSLTSCSTDNEELPENLNSQNTNEQFFETSDFIPDFNKVYTITSASDPLTLATDGNGRLLSTSKNEITVQELWRFSPSTTVGSFYIDCLGGKTLPRLSTISGRGILSPTFGGEDSVGLSSSWSVTSAGSDEYFITNLGEDLDVNRLTSVSFGFSSISYGARLTTDDSEASTEKFEITEITFPFTDNRVPVTLGDGLRISVGETLTANVLDNDYDPDGDELTIISFTSDDDRISVELIDNQLRVRLNSSFGIFGSADVKYTVSDGNGGATVENLDVFSPRSNN